MSLFYYQIVKINKGFYFKICRQQIGNPEERNTFFVSSVQFFI
jgi:hypothetical protein